MHSISPYLSAADWVIPPLFVMFIIVYSLYIKNKHERFDEAYRYYLPGIMVKLIGSISLCLVYTLYYKAGDATSYFEQGRTIYNLLFKHADYFFEVVFEGPTHENYCYMDEQTTYIEKYIWFGDYSAMFLSRMITPFYFICFNSFLGTTILLCWCCYGGMWKLYMLFCEQFPAIKKELAISILFIPSVVFWGSGLLKDTITLACVGWYSYGFYKLLIQNRYNIKNILYVFVSAYLLVALKPYILVALLPGSLIWLSYDKIAKTRNKVIRFIIAPIIMIGGVAGAFYSLTSLGNALGEYSMDTILDRAVVVQRDLKSGYYGDNSFDIGDFDANVGSIAGKAPLAINAALFRPYVWEVKNPLMLLTALESAYIMVLTLGLLFRLKFFGFFRFIWENPLLLFSVLFSLFFAFSVGLSTPNFGALARLKIPCIPFFVASLFVLRHLYEKKTKKKFRF
ncbi:MAG: hypothetical protein ACXVC6_05060 [Bacteroidia bacterium]